MSPSWSKRTKARRSRSTKSTKTRASKHIKAQLSKPTMESNKPTFPIHKWPYKPCWELDGFDFSMIPVALFKSAARALGRREFTTGISKTKRPSEADYSRMATNNVAVQFQAILYCKDYHPSWAFWRRADKCGLSCGIQKVKSIEALFVQARKAYLQSTTNCPNNAAQLVDRWIGFRDSASVATRHPVQESDTAPWDVLYQEWCARMKRGEFIDCGQFLRPLANTTTNSPVRDAPMPRPVGSPPASRGSLDNMPLKREDTAQSASIVELDSVPSGKRVSKRKRKNSTASGSRPPKRRACSFQQTDEITDDELQMLEPSTGSAQGSRPSVPTLRVPAEHESSLAVEQHESLSTSRKIAADLKSTKARLTKCEGKFAEHLNLIHAQDFRLAAQGELVENHTIQLNGLEPDPAANGGIEEIRKSIDELMDRQNNRSTYIRAEVKKRWNDVRSPLEQAQSRTDSRLDTIRDELAVLKTRIADCQKAINHNNKEKDIRQLETTLKTKVRAQRKRVDGLFTRIAELEENFDDGNTSPAPNNEIMIKENMSQVDKRVTALAERFATLETKQKRQTEYEQSAIEKIFRRLDALEAGRTAHGKQADEPLARFARQEHVADTGRTGVPDRRAAEQETRCFRHATERETRFARYERVEEPARTEIANARGQMWNSGIQTVPAPVQTRASHPHPHPDQPHGHHQGAQRQPRQGYYKAETREG